jgi:hypothetical protein
VLAELRAIVSGGMVDPSVYAEMFDKATGMMLHSVADSPDGTAPPVRRSQDKPRRLRPPTLTPDLTPGLEEIAKKRGGVPEWWGKGPTVALQDATAGRQRNG